VTGLVDRGEAIEAARQRTPRTVAAGGLALLAAVLLAAVAVRPLTAAAALPVLAVVAMAAARQPWAVRGISSAIGAAAICVVFVIVAESTAAAVVVGVVGLVGLAGVAVAAWFTEAAGRVALVAAGVIACAAALFVTMLWPALALAGGAAALVCVVAWEVRSRLAPGLPAMRPAVVVPAAAGLVAVAAAFAVWPATTALVLVVAAAAVLSWRAPGAAVALAILLVGFEGSIKLLLSLEDSPLPGTSRAAGAAAIDIALFCAIAGALISDRGRAARELWSRAAGRERAAAAALGVWLAASVVQIVQGGHPVRGLEGFRLFQLYSLVAVAAALVCAQPAVRRRAISVLLWVGLAVAAYAAFRVAVGPAAAERRAALSIETVTGYGGAFRAVGSFSSAVGMASFLTPVAVLALVVAYLAPRLRRLALATAVLALVGLVGSYSRASLVGVVLGLVCALALLIVAADVSRRRKLISVGLVLVTLGFTYGGIQVAAQASPQLRVRARGVLNPFHDASMKLRWRTWKETVRGIRREPLGHGVGSVGSASAPTRRRLKTTDNSFLKVFFEQGVLVGALFVWGVLGTVAVLAGRLRRLTGDARAAGFAGLAGFVAFLAISLTGEYVEQPGKVVAWACLGMAVAMAFSGPATGGARREDAE
jgi:hypothetical protein